MKKVQLPSKGGSFLRAKDGTLSPNKSKTTPEPAPAALAKTGSGKPAKKEA